MVKVMVLRYHLEMKYHWKKVLRINKELEGLRSASSVAPVKCVLVLRQMSN